MYLYVIFMDKSFQYLSACKSKQKHVFNIRETNKKVWL